MPRHITYRERAHERGWNARYLVDREHSRRWLARHGRRGYFSRHDRPWWWWLANR